MRSHEGGWGKVLRQPRAHPGGGPPGRVASAAQMPDALDRTGYELAFDDDFSGPDLDPGRWVAHYLPQWTTPERSAARYDLTPGVLRLRIDADQPAWRRRGRRAAGVEPPDRDLLRAARLAVGQHRHRPDLAGGRRAARTAPVHAVRSGSSRPSCGRAPTRPACWRSGSSASRRLARAVGRDLRGASSSATRSSRELRRPDRASRRTTTRGCARTWWSSRSTSTPPTGTLRRRVGRRSGSASSSTTGWCARWSSASTIRCS